MIQTLDLLRQARALLGAVARADRALLPDDDLIALLGAEEEVGRLLDAARALTTGEVTERSRFELGGEGLSMRHGHRKPVHLIEQVTRASQSEVLRRMRVGAAVSPRQTLLGTSLPPLHASVATALTEGSIGLDSAASIIFHLKQAASGSAATPDRMDAAEAALVEVATRESTDLVADAGRAWRDALDPDGIEPRFDDILQRRGATFGRERNGITNIHIKSEPILTAILRAAVQEPMGDKAVPRFMSDEDRAAGTSLVQNEEGEFVEVLTDLRSFEQRNYDAVAAVFTAGLRATQDGPTAYRTIGSVTAVIRLRDLKAGTGFGVIEGSDESVPASVLRELACEVGFTRVYLGDGGESLVEGLLERFFTPAQRRAMVARDGDRCVFTGCKTVAAASHGHHVVFWADRGPTDIDNGVLLCPMHHHALHQGAFEIRMRDGIPWLRTRADSWDDSAWVRAGRNRLLMTVAA
jgi:hypothetical protein